MTEENQNVREAGNETQPDKIWPELELETGDWKDSLLALLSVGRDIRDSNLNIVNGVAIPYSSEQIHFMELFASIPENFLDRNSPRKAVLNRSALARVRVNQLLGEGVELSSIYNRLIGATLKKVYRAFDERTEPLNRITSTLSSYFGYIGADITQNTGRSDLGDALQHIDCSYRLNSVNAYLTFMQGISSNELKKRMVKDFERFRGKKLPENIDNWSDERKKQFNANADSSDFGYFVELMGEYRSFLLNYPIKTAEDLQ